MPFEFSILNFIQEHLRNDVLDDIMVFITNLGDAGIVWIVLTAALLFQPKMRTVGMMMATALICDMIFCNFIVKPFVARIRPYEIYTGIKLLVPALSDYSFPSGHTAASFAATTVLYLSGHSTLWKGACVLAVLIALSRLYLYVHFPTDILGGIVLGIFCGMIGYKMIQSFLTWKGSI